MANIDNPPIWRRVTVPASYSFEDFHFIIQAAFGWENYHLYRFSDKEWSSKSIIVDRSEAELGNDFSNVEKIASDEIRLSDPMKVQMIGCSFQSDEKNKSASLPEYKIMRNNISTIFKTLSGIMLVLSLYWGKIDAQES